jgi:vacuolar-type H+-ATPase subunit H
MMEIFRILDELEVIVKESKHLPFTGGKVLIESNRFLDRLDRVRAILPEELEKARMIIYEKDKIVQEACADAEDYIKKSRGKVEQMVDENEITKSAMDKADEIINQAEEAARGIYRDANIYAEEVLNHMEMVLTKGLEAVNQGKEEISVILEDKED